MDRRVAERIEAACADAGQRGGRIEPLVGGASARTFWRVELAGGAMAVAMVMPEGGPAAEEAGGGDEDGLRRWLGMRDALAVRGVPVPAVLGVVPGVALLEDLGDERLFERLNGAPDGTAFEAHLRGAADLLAAFQRQTADLTVPRFFDAAVMRAELDEFRTMGLMQRNGVTLTAAEEATWAAVVARVVTRLDALPKVLAHRDFQSQNIMLPAERAVLVDFQDAFMAPAAYDWVALLRDSYIALAPDVLTRALTLASPAVREAFALQTIQRKLKDAGRFVTLEARGKRGFLRWYGRTIGYVLDAMREDGGFNDAMDLLARHIPEARAHLAESAA
jgi:aminoglycoside/choline kinase family phosphotransferase